METEPAAIDARVQGVLDAQPPAMGRALTRLRTLIFAAATQTPTIGPLIETLKWGEPAYLPRTPRTGTTIRINAVKSAPAKYAALFHCKTTLVESFRLLYPDILTFSGNRAIRLDLDEPVPEAALTHCFALALTYHLTHAAHR